MPENTPQISRPAMPEEYGIPNTMPGLDWAWAVEQLVAARNYWVASTRPDGRPHTVPIWGIWFQGALYFATDQRSVKGRNLAANPAVCLHLESGDQTVILEGEVREETDPALLNELDAVYMEKYNGTHLIMDPGSHAVIYCLRPRVAFGWLEKDFLNSAARWKF